MDPTTAILGPWTQLGVVGSVVIALGYVCWTQRSERNARDQEHRKEMADRNAAHLADVKGCEARVSSLVEKNTDALNGVKGAMESLERVVETAMTKR